MSRLVLFDAGPLSLVTNPKGSEEARRCNAWLKFLLGEGVAVKIPEGTDYEVRRDLLRAGRRTGVNRLDYLARQVGYLPINMAVWLRAAELWAQAKNEGKSVADDRELDFDIVLAAQALLSTEDGYTVTVATTNVGHLGRFVDAQLWESITG
jgi:predicted nucleic acid-binding protein